MSREGSKGMHKEIHNDPWAALYELMGEEVPKNEAERMAARKLREGCSIFEARECSGLTDEEFSDLYERLGKWENEVLCGDRETFLTYQKKAEERMKQMSRIELRINYVPMETAVYVSQDGKISRRSPQTMWQSTMISSVPFLSHRDFPGSDL